jgi:hypothetical protein
MALKGKLNLIGRDSLPVIYNSDILLAAGSDIHADITGASVNAVLHRLLDDRGRALDNLAGRNLCSDLG